MVSLNPSPAIYAFKKDQLPNDNLENKVHLHRKVIVGTKGRIYVKHYKIFVTGS